MFDLCDGDGSGTIDCKELTTVLCIRGILLSEIRVKSLISQFSETKAEELQFEEFCYLLASLSETAGGGQTMNLLKTLDAELEQENARLRALLDQRKVDEGADSESVVLALPQTVSLTVTENMKPGTVQEVSYGPNSDRHFRFMLPADAMVGTTLTIPVPTNEENSATPEDTPRLVSMTITDMMKPGTKAKVKYGPNKEKEFEFTVPDNAITGMTLQVPIPIEDTL